MPSFRKKPVIIEAVRAMDRVVIPGNQTLHGQDLIVEAGDWVIKGVKGELYPCKDDIFRETYEPVGKEGVQALTAPELGDPEDREYIIPFPCGPAPVVLENTTADTLS